jgi:hypothetical protein
MSPYILFLRPPPTRRSGTKPGADSIGFHWALSVFFEEQFESIAKPKKKMSELGCGAL